MAHAQSDSVNLLTGKWRCFIFSCWTCCCCCCHSYRCCCCRRRRCYWNVGCSTFLEFLEALTKTFCSGEDYKTSQPEMNVFLKLNLKLAMESFIVVVRFFFLFNRGSASFIGGPFRSESTHTHTLWIWLRWNCRWSSPRAAATAKMKMSLFNVVRRTDERTGSLFWEQIFRLFAKAGNGDGSDGGGLFFISNIMFITSFSFVYNLLPSQKGLSPYCLFHCL